MHHSEEIFGHSLCRSDTITSHLSVSVPGVIHVEKQRLFLSSSQAIYYAISSNVSHTLQNPRRSSSSKSLTHHFSIHISQSPSHPNILSQHPTPSLPIPSTQLAIQPPPSHCLSPPSTPPRPDLIRPSRPPRSRTARAVHILRPRMLRNLDAKTLMPGIVPCKVAVAQALGDDVAAFRVLEVFVVAHVD